MYFPDLTNYFKSQIKNQSVLRVGWLTKGRRFPTGRTSTLFAEKLLTMCKNPVNRTRGFHQCDFCVYSDFAVKIQQSDQQIYLGSAEIWVSDEQNRIYVAPNLIYHYVTAHQYYPPDDFIEAVLSTEKGLSQEEVDALCQESDEQLSDNLSFPNKIGQFIQGLLGN